MWKIYIESRPNKHASILSYNSKPLPYDIDKEMQINQGC